MPLRRRSGVLRGPARAAMPDDGLPDRGPDHPRHPRPHPALDL